MSGMNGTGIAASSLTTVTKETVPPPVTPALSPDSSKDPKVIAAYVCFGVGAFIILVAIILIIVFLVYRSRRRSKQKEAIQLSTLNRDDYKFPGTTTTTTGIPISTISDGDRRISKMMDAPDYNFTGNGYRFPLATRNDALTQRHPLDDDETTSLPVVLPIRRSSQSTDSISPYPSRSSIEMSSGESGLAEMEGYVRLHRSSPLAGINAIYSSNGELSPEYENTNPKTNSGETRNVRRDIGSRDIRKDVIGSRDMRRDIRSGDIRKDVTGSRNIDSSRRSSLQRTNNNFTENARNFGNGSHFIGTVNEGFISDDYYDTPKIQVRGGSLRTSLDRLKRDRVAPVMRSHSNRKSSVLLENAQMNNGVYHVSLRHDGSSVTQTSVVKHPT